MDWQKYKWDTTSIINLSFRKSKTTNLTSGVIFKLMRSIYKPRKQTAILLRREGIYHMYRGREFTEGIMNQFMTKSFDVSLRSYTDAKEKISKQSKHRDKETHKKREPLQPLNEMTSRHHEHTFMELPDGDLLMNRDEDQASDTKKLHKDPSLLESVNKENLNDTSSSGNNSSSSSSDSSSSDSSSEDSDEENNKESVKGKVQEDSSWKRTGEQSAKRQRMYKYFGEDSSNSE